MEAPTGLREATTLVQGSTAAPGGGLDPVLAAAAGGAGLALIIALCAMLFWLRASSKLKGIQTKLSGLSLEFEAFQSVAQPRPLPRDGEYGDGPSQEDYLKLYNMYNRLKQQVQLLEAELSRLTGDAKAGQDAPAARVASQAAPPSAASGRSVNPGDVRARTRDAAAQLQALYDRPYPLQAEVSRTGAVFLRMNASGGLVPEPASGPHSDRWFLAVKDSTSEAYALYFGPRVVRERTKLRVASDFLASLETYFEVRQGFNNLELADACIIDIDASGAVSVLERGAAQA